MAHLAFEQPENSVAKEMPMHVLRYRPHVRWFYQTLMGVGALLAFIGIAGGAYAMSQHNIKAFIAFWAPLIAGVCVLAEAVFLLRPLVYARVEIYGDRFVIKSLGTKTEFYFAQLEEIHFVTMGFAGGWFRVKRLGDDKGYRFSVVLENSYSIVSAIERARPELFKDRKRIERFKKSMIYADHSWQRYYELLSDWSMLLFKYLVFPSAGVLVLIDAVKTTAAVPPQYKEFVGLVVGFAFPMACLLTGWSWFVLKEQWLAQRVSKMRLAKHAPLVIARDRKLESRLDTAGMAIYFGLGAAIVLFVLV